MYQIVAPITIAYLVVVLLSPVDKQQEKNSEKSGSKSKIEEKHIFKKKD